VADPSQSHPLFSIGHSNHPIETFLGLLTAHRIDVVADVRTAPYSKYVPQYNANELNVAVERNGQRYLFMGKELGGRPEGEEFYDDADHVLYSRVARADFFLAGIARLEKGIRTHRIALLCSEEDPAVCHRHLLIGRVLAERGTVLQHIRGDGRVQTDDEVAAKPADPSSLQLGLFPEAEDQRWRSLRSVSRKDPRATSSEP
jgi:uncharacterized protein (DUF488 family)